MKLHNVVVTVEIIVDSDKAVPSQEDVRTELINAIKHNRWFHVSNDARVVCTREVDA